MSTANSAGARRGELRIYFGAAPGVGKTFAMLGEAHRRAERGTDVVVGLVETRGRARTAALLDGLEVVPGKQVHHDGTVRTELDVAAVLARGPEVAVVDDLAHTNAPGLANTKRWQDIELLRDAGIDVLSTINVQHLESLTDVVEGITGTRERETVPDEVVRRAEQVELIDITPEALRRRLAHGNVFPASRIDAELANYFRPGNLTALRELALLWVADQVDVALRRYRDEKQITETWETRERVVVAVTGGPETETLIRRARRIAARAGADLMVLHILRGAGPAAAPPQSLAAMRRLAEDLGATFHTVVGDDVPRTMLDFARAVNATQLVVGTSRRSRLARLFDEGIGATAVQLSGPIDVHMVTHEEAGRGWRHRLAHSPLAASRRALGLLVAVLGQALVTLVGVLLLGQRDSPAAVVVAYFLVIVLAAVAGGLAPALVAAAAAGLLLTFFFASPYHSPLMANADDVLVLVAMLLVAVLVAVVVDNAARRTVLAARAGTEATLLASYARIVLTHPEPLSRLLEKIRENFGMSAVVMLERRNGEWHRVASAGEPSFQVPDDADVDVPVTEEVHLALRGRNLPAGDQAVLQAAAGQALLTLRQQRMALEAERAKRQAETTQLRTALLSAVGHDLRTPLTSIKTAIGSLRAPELTLSTEDQEELLATVEESVDRLTGLIDNLLDSSRLATGAVLPRLRPVGYDEIVARAVPSPNASEVDGRGLISVEVGERLPLVLADPGLLERVVANVVDNALRHGLPARHAGDEPPVAIRGSAHADRVELRVVDHGKGVPKRAVDTLFTPFQRLGDTDTTSGIGLGLSVAKGFVEAMSGTIRAEHTPGGGLTVVIALPAASAA